MARAMAQDGFSEGVRTGLQAVRNYATDRHQAAHAAGHAQGLQAGQQQGRSRALWDGYQLGQTHQQFLHQHPSTANPRFEGGYHLGAEHVAARIGADIDASHPDYHLGHRHGMEQRNVEPSGSPRRMQDHIYELAGRHTLERLQRTGAVRPEDNPRYALGQQHGQVVGAEMQHDGDAFVAGYFAGDQHARDRHGRGFPPTAPGGEAEPERGSQRSGGSGQEGQR